MFQITLSQQAPCWLEPDIAKLWNERIPTVIHRHELLQEAWTVFQRFGRPFSAFHKGAKILFDTERLDMLTPQQVADMAAFLTATAEPEAERMDFPNAKVVVDTAFATTKDWELIRHTGIGGSDPASVLGIGPFRGPQDVFADKRGIPLLRSANRGQEFLFEYGHSVEPVVINQFCRITGARRLPETRMFQCSERPELIADIDGILEMPDGTIALFEAKTANPAKMTSWNEAPPPYYTTQCVHYMGVLNDPRVTHTYIGCVFSNAPGDYRAHCIERNAEREAQQFSAMSAFWNNYVVPGIDPPLIGNPDVDTSYIRRRFKKDDLSTVRLSSDLADSCKQWLELREQRADLKAQLAEVERQLGCIGADLEYAMGSHQSGLCGGYQISAKPRRTPGGIDTEKLRLAYPAVFQACRKQAPESQNVTLAIKPVK